MAAMNKFTFIPSPCGPFLRIDPSARLVFGLIWDRYRLSRYSTDTGDNRWQDDDGEVYCVYSQTELSEHSGLTDRTVRRCLDTLYNANLLRWHKSGFNGCNRYYPDLLVIDYLTRKD